MQRINGFIVVGGTSFELLRLRANRKKRRVIGSNGKITPSPMLLSDRYLLVLLDHQGWRLSILVQALPQKTTIAVFML
jgi:hypothetical protein